MTESNPISSPEQQHTPDPIRPNGWHDIIKFGKAKNLDIFALEHAAIYYGYRLSVIRDAHDMIPQAKKNCSTVTCLTDFKDEDEKKKVVRSIRKIRDDADYDKYLKQAKRKHNDWQCSCTHTPKKRDEWLNKGYIRENAHRQGCYEPIPALLDIAEAQKAGQIHTSAQEGDTTENHGGIEDTRK